MKFFTSMKFAVTALLLAVGMNVMADEITWTASEQGYANAEDVTEITFNDYLSATLDKGDNKNGPKYYNAGKALRIYGGNTLTITAAEGAKILSVAFTFASGDGTNEIKSDLGSYANGAWEGEAAAVTFTIDGTSGHRRIATISITYQVGDTPVVMVAKPVITPESGTYYEPQTVTITAEEGTEIFYTINGGETQNYEAPFVVSETSTIVAWAENEDGDASSKTTVEIKIIADLTLTGDGTVENPYTVADALAIIKAGAYTNDKVYVKGIITQVGIEKEGAMTDLPGNSFGNATYFIADAADSETSLEVYRGKDFNGNNFTNEDDIKVGDEIIIYGALTLYKETPEVAQNSQIYMLNGKTERETQPVDPITTVGDGTQENPYTVADVLALYAASQAPEGKVWTIGYIVAYVEGTKYDADKVIFDIPTGDQTEIVLADAVEETDYTKTLPVQLPAGTIREKLDISANESLFHKQALVYGSIEKYFGVAGVKNVTDAIVDGVSVDISQVNAPEVVSMGIYTVAGQKVQNVTRGGLYIIGGKKVMVK